MIEKIFQLTLCACVYFVYSTALAQQDGILMSYDTLNYLCSFDFRLDGVGRSKISKPLDQDFVKLISNVEIDARSASYIAPYECDFIRTAGATWRNNQQIFLYNPKRIKDLRSKHTHRDSLSILFKGIILHEFGHHFMPHSVILLARKRNLKPDSIKIFERQADNYMGQMLRRIYNVRAYQAKSVINHLIDENDDAQQYFSKRERIQNVLEGWDMGGHTLADRSPMYNSFLKLQASRDATTFGDVLAFSSVFGYPKEIDSLRVDASEALAEFKVTIANGFEYLSMRLPSARLHRPSEFKIIGAIAESSSAEFPRIVYDQYFVTWYISKHNTVFALSDRMYIYLGKID